MILSLEIHRDKQLDVFSFFRVKNAISIPPELWFPAICSSLKNKHSVLIVLNENHNFSEWNTTKRTLVSDDWCWLSPRSLSLIRDAYGNYFTDFDGFKTFLISCK